MAKKNQKIKTARYWTRECPFCGFKYPNWFTVCPKCNKSWDEAIKAAESGETVAEIAGASGPRTIRIIAQVQGAEIREMNLHFSADNGVSWFSMPMVKENDYYVAEIRNVPPNTIIIYYLKGIDANGTEFEENNNGEFYYYYVSETEEGPITDIEEFKKKIAAATPREIGPAVPESASTTSPVAFDDGGNPFELKGENIESTPPPSVFSDNGENGESPRLIFTPLNKIKKDKNLKECPGCHAKIKTKWTVCPICGYHF